MCIRIDVHSKCSDLQQRNGFTGDDNDDDHVGQKKEKLNNEGWLGKWRGVLVLFTLKRNVSERLFLFALGIQDIAYKFSNDGNEQVPNKIGIMKVVCLYKWIWLVVSE